MQLRSYPYAVSRVKASESSLISRNSWDRLYEANIEDAFRLLHDMNYGKNAKNQNNIDELTQDSVNQARELINEISPDEALTNLFLLQVDGHNIKTILKGLLQREDIADILLPGGTIPIDELQEAFEKDTFEILPLKIREAVEEFNPSDPPGIISAKIDNSVFDQILFVLSQRKFNNPLIKRYFLAKIDFTNILTIIRSYNLKWDKSHAIPYLIPGGNLDTSILLSALEAERSKLPEILSLGEYSSTIFNAINDFLNSGSLLKMENDFYNKAYEIIHEEYMDSFGIGPIINYLLQKEFEARTLRVMFAAKRSKRKVTLSELGVSQ